MLKLLSFSLWALLAFMPLAPSAARQLAPEGTKPAPPRAQQRDSRDHQLALVDAARSQVGVTVTYDPAYQRLAYPNGDVPIERGVCTDVVVRAYRALGADLQVLVHQDLKKAGGAYPHQSRWQLKAPDRNIDHRRVPNLATYFARHGTTVPPSKEKKNYRPGDVVTWDLSRGLTHIGIVTEKLSRDGVPLIVHNIGSGAQEEDILFAYPITGHYRWQPDGAKSERKPGASE